METGAFGGLLLLRVQRAPPRLAAALQVPRLVSSASSMLRPSGTCTTQARRILTGRSGLRLGFCRETLDSGDSGDATRKPLSVLLVSQLESADTVTQPEFYASHVTSLKRARASAKVVINKTDLAACRYCCCSACLAWSHCRATVSQVSPEELDKVRQLVSALSPNARQFPATKGAIPMRRDHRFYAFRATDVSTMRTLLPADPVDLDMPACFGRKGSHTGGLLGQASRHVSALGNRAYSKRNLFKIDALS